MSELFQNNAISTLAAGISASATSITLQTGDGALYPNPTAPDFFRAVLFKKSTGEWEIVTCATRSGDICTITRAQEGTTAISFNANDEFEARPTAAFFSSLTVTSTNIQDNSFKYDAETGVADAYVITPTPVIAAYGVGQEFWFIPTNNSTGGACTLSVSSVATPPRIKLIDGLDPYADALTAGRMAHVIHDGTSYILLNPVYNTSTNDVATLGTVEADKVVTADSLGEINMSGGKVQPSVFGTFTTASLAQHATESLTVTHGLGTNDVDIFCTVFGSRTLASGGAANGVAVMIGTDKRQFYAGKAAAGTATAVPLTGDVNIYATNRDANAQTITVKYVITKRS